MYGLEEPFYEATADYARLSFRLLSVHPFWYAFSAARSFWAFWTDDVPMVPALIGHRGEKVLLPLDRCLSIGIGVCFFSLPCRPFVEAGAGRSLFVLRRDNSAGVWLGHSSGTGGIRERTSPVCRPYDAFVDDGHRLPRRKLSPTLE